MRYVIIGAGIAGTTAAEEIKKIESEAEVTLIGVEDQALYSRVLLPHYVEGKIPREKVFLKKEHWYADQGIEYMRGVRATKIDTENQFVETSEGREIPYDRLLITTGGDVNLIHEDKPGVAYFYTLADADHMVELLARIKTLPESDRNAAIYGGGFITLEYLNMFQKHGVAASVFMRSDQFWSRILSKESSDVLIRHIESHGFDVLTGIPDFTLIGDDELEAIELPDGKKVDAKILGVGIGIHADHKLFEDAGIESSSGVLTDEFLETNVEHVYAAGDIAEFFDTHVGRKVKYGNWMNAQMQARVVAKTMTGNQTPFSLVSSYATDVLGMNIAFVGDVDRKQADNLVQSSLTDTSSLELFERNGKTVGAVLIGDVSKRMDITKAIKNGELYVKEA